MDYGKIEINFNEIRNIKDMDDFSDSDPIVKTHVQQTDGKSLMGWKTSSEQSGTNCPSGCSWNNHYWPSAAEDVFKTKIDFQVWDVDLLLQRPQSEVSADDRVHPETPVDDSYNDLIAIEEATKNDDLGSGSFSMSDLPKDNPAGCREKVESDSCFSSWKTWKQAGGMKQAGGGGGMKQGSITYKYRWKPAWKDGDKPWAAVARVNTKTAVVESPKGDYGTSEGAEAVPTYMGLISNKNHKFCRSTTGGDLVCDQTDVAS
jgi:hypothetical protein